MKMFFFGLGFSARALAPLLAERGFDLAATTRTDGSDIPDGITAVPFDGSAALPDGALQGVTHVLSSVPPGDDGDPVLNRCLDSLAGLPGLRWAGYLSTTGVYGDRQGDWVDETGALRPVGRRGERRVQAEQQWLTLQDRIGGAVQIFRLAGIYGPGRNNLAGLRAGTARRIVKPGQVFSRIHVADIAQVLLASIDRPERGGIYNVCDDEPAPPQDVVEFAARLAGLPVPPDTPFDTADLSPMARSFYGESKRVRNDRIRRDLGVELKYPNYRDGYRAIVAGESD